MKKKWIIIGVVAIIVVLIGVNIFKSQSVQTTEVETVSLEKEIMQETVMTPGVLQLKDEQFVYYQADKGEVDEIFVEAGDTVDKGDKLLNYEDKQLELDKKQNQLQINSATLELDKLKEQHADIDKEVDKDPDNEMLQEEHDEIKMQQQQADIELEQALLEKDSIENQMEESTVTAEVKGKVLTVDKQASEQGQMGEKAIIQIGTLDNVVVEGIISEYDTMNIEVDQPVTLTSDAVPDEEWQGKVSYISDLPEEEEVAVGQEDTSVDYPIEITLDDDINLKPGFKMLIEIITSESEVGTLPISCVEQEDENNFVYVVEDGKAKQVEVKIGSVDSEKMAIKEGISEKDKVILNPSDGIYDGMDVTVK